MAARTNRHPTPEYRAQGGAAYDIYRAPQRRPQPAELPEERPAPPRVRRVRAHVGIAPFAVIGLGAAVFLAVLVIFGYVRIYETDRQIASLQRELTTLQEERDKLESSYENKIDLAEIESRALALGMTQPRTGQTVYLDLGGTDHAEIAPEKHENIVLQVFHAIRDSVLGFVEYLS